MRASAVVSVLSLSALASCCRPPTAPLEEPAPAPGATPAIEATPETEQPSAPALSARHVTMSWGTTGVWGAGAPPAWVIGLVDVTASEQLSGLRLESLAISDAAGTVLARGASELELRLSPEGRSDRDFSRHGTEDFGGGVPAGTTVRLWVHARLDVPFSDLGARPARYELTLATESGEEVRLAGPLEAPWPTA